MTSSAAGTSRPSEGRPAHAPDRAIIDAGPRIGCREFCSSCGGCVMRRVETGGNVAVACDGTMVAPAATRNLPPIMDILLPQLPDRGAFLEIGSGTGQHVAAFAARMPGLTFHPSDPDPPRRRAIDRLCGDLPNVRPARDLDAGIPRWADGMRAQVLYLANVLHLVSDAEMAVLLDESCKALAPGGLIALYGPFLRGGRAISANDRSFDAALREQDPAIGLKDIETVETVLGVLGLSSERIEMPANNVLLLARSPDRAS